MARSLVDDVQPPLPEGADPGVDLARCLPSHTQAVTVARRLARAGWVVVEVVDPRPRPDGTALVAGVYHPNTYDSPGDVTWANCALDPGG